MVAWAQTVAVVVAALVSAYAVAISEFNRRQDARRRRVERVLEATLNLAEAAVRVGEIQGQGPAFEVAKRRLRAELQIVGVTGFASTDLMLSKTAEAAAIVRQSDTAIQEIRQRLDEIDSETLLRRVLHRPADVPVDQTQPRQVEPAAQPVTLPHGE